MIIPGELLWQSVKNALVYSVGKSLIGGTNIQMHLDRLTFTTSDNFVGVQSVAPGSSRPGSVFSTWITHESLKKFEGWLRDKQSEDLEVMLTTDPAEEEVLQVAYTDSRAKELGLGMGEVLIWLPVIPTPNPEWWEMFRSIFDSISERPVLTEPFEVAPARLQKLNLLEPKNQYPVSLKSFMVNTTRVVGLRYGPNTQLVLMPLDRVALEEAFPNLEEVVW